MAKTILIGWDAADWQVLDGLMAQGKMPALKDFLKRGIRANMATLKPVLSPLLWTSIATGQRAHEHGILGFMQSSGLEEQPVPVQANVRKVPAIWNILNAAEQKTNVVNWWPSYPVEALKGCMVSNQFATAKPGEPLKALRTADFYPAKIREFTEELRVHPDEFSPAHLWPFFPEHSLEDLQSDPLVGNVAQILAKASSVHGVFTELLEKHPADFHAVYFEALDHLSHLAMKYHPPKVKGIKETDFEKYQKVVEAGYRFHDMLLERTLELAGPDTNFILISDHGFQSGWQRSPELPDLPAAPALEHRNLGVLAAMGPDFKQGENLYGVSLLDVMPTLLHLHGLPVGEDLPGRVLTELFQNPQPVSTIGSWQQVVPEMKFLETQDTAAPEVLRQLEALGYVELPDKHRAETLENDWQYNRAVSLLDANKKEEALQVTQNLYQRDQSLRVSTLLADLFLQNGQWQAFEKLKDQWPAALHEHPFGYFLKGQAALMQANFKEALAHFKAIDKKGVQSTQLWHEIARTLWASGQFAAADNYWNKILAQEPDHAAALSGKAEMSVQQANYEEALSYLEKSLELRFYQPQAHYLMALCFHHLQEKEAGQQALQICLKQAPKHQKALFLAQDLGLLKAEETAETVVVSGFPRSGTSMLMRILAQGGLPVLSDEQRKADAHNPKGYWEYEPIKQLAFKPNILGATAGQALKVVAPLVPYLPADRSYVLLWMDRPLLEVILSQQRMKNEQNPARDFPFKLALDYEREKERLTRWLNQQPHIRWKAFDYQQFLTNPQKSLNELQVFLGRPLNQKEAMAAIDPNLHRTKIG